MRDVVFIHGWGCDSSVWNGLVNELSGFITPHFIELGFFEDSPANVPALPAGCVVVGHSFGVLWALYHLKNPAAFVSIAGFDSFTAYVPGMRVALKMMQKRMERDPAGLMHDFWAKAGFEDFYKGRILNIRALKQGLVWLEKMDARYILQDVSCPVLALMADNDSIVPAEMSHAIWPSVATGGVFTCPEASHALPHSQPEWCAKHIKHFLVQALVR